MNLLLHGLEAPNINPNNSLDVPLKEIGDKDRVNVILTNPPFGGEEERGILGNFPEDKQTAETALLFMQYLMRILKRRPKPGRAGVVVPDGTLFGDGIAGRIKEELLEKFTLHTIVRLPKGVFAPYTDIRANLLFFNAVGPTKEIWFYEMQPPEGRKNYSKTVPMQYEEFSSCLAWWDNRVENELAWRVDFAQLYACARDKATPHWDAAKEAEANAQIYAREAKEFGDAIREVQKEPNPEDRVKQTIVLEEERQRSLAGEAKQRDIARHEKAAGDSIYWPIYNLDIKNPHVGERIEHLPPEQIVSSIMEKETRIAEILTEVKK